MQATTQSVRLRARWILPLAALAMGAFAPSSARANLLDNGGFETWSSSGGFVSWSSMNGATLALDWSNQGGLVQLVWTPLNPWTGANPGSFGSEVNLQELITPGTTVNATWMSWLGQLADGFQQLEDQDVVVLTRFMSEMNGRWFWWGNRPRQDYIAVWRHLFDYMVNVRHPDNLLFVYESDSSVYDTYPLDYFYPGDDVVDEMGHNLYSDSWALSYDANALYRQYPKVYSFSEAGSSTITDGTWNNLIISQMAGSLYPRVSYFVIWNSFVKDGGATTVIKAIVDNQNVQQLMDDPQVVDRSELAF